MPAILPEPRQLALQEGYWRKSHRSHFSGSVRIGIHSPAEWRAPASWLQDSLKHEQMFRVEDVSLEEADFIFEKCPFAGSQPGPNENLRLVGFQNESYRIEARPEHVLIKAASAHGAARAVASLRQMLSGQRARLELPCCVLEDGPAFSWRGMHLDCSRHFWCVDDVLRFIDLAALHKFNVFHWHLTDDQGWRLPVEGYPRLTGCAAWRDGTMVGHDCDRATNPQDGVRHGGFYSHDEIRRVVAHAEARGMHVLPEIDVPGHVQALLTAYPEFGNTGLAPGVRTCWGISPHTLNLEPQTFEFLERVIDTVADLFPFPLVHLGGDEAQIDEWMKSPRIPERMAELGIPGVSGIQPFFTQRLVEMLTRRGRRMVGWDEIFEGERLDASAVLMYWRDSEKNDHALDRKALERGNGLVLANWSKTYFDLYQEAGPGRDFEPLAICGRLTLEDVYRWNPLARYPEALATGVWGGQAQVWTEYIPNRPHLDYMVYPRACALSQVLWRGGDREDFPHFLSRLERHLPLLDRLGVAYRPSFPPPPDNTSQP